MPTEKGTVIETLLETFEQIESLLIKEKNESATSMPYAQRARCYWKWGKRVNQMLEKMGLCIISKRFRELQRYFSRGSCKLFVGFLRATSKHLVVMPF